MKNILLDSEPIFVGYTLSLIELIIVSSIAGNLPVPP